MAQIRTCVACSKVFQAKPCQKCCSPECVTSWGHIKSKRNYAQSKTRSRASATCIVCGEQFEYHFRPERGPRQFHTRGCASKYYIQNGTFDAWRLRTNPKTGIYVPCNECGEPNYIVTHQFTQELHFCDMICKGKYWSHTFVGPNNPMFGKTMSEEAKRKQLETLQKNHPGITNAFMLSKQGSASKPQLEVFERLKTDFPLLSFEHEQWIGEHRVDIVSKTHKLIIEYNGDYWHANPEKYAADDFNWKKMQTSSEIWQHDKKRIYALQNYGYSFYVIWERSFLNRRTQTYEDLQRWINDQAKNYSALRPSVDLADVKLGELLETFDDNDTTTQSETVNVNV